MNNLIGRAQEISILQKAYHAPDSQLVAVYGRRRIGKTFLIRQVFEKQLTFELTGSIEATTKSQLERFASVLTKASKAVVPAAIPKNWTQGFTMLEQWLETVTYPGKKVLFFDELPWLHTKRSGFLSAFIYF